jgi:hypothetical protein
MTTLRRITNAIDTVPAKDSALNGSVTVSTSDATALLYSGTSDMNKLYPPQEMYGNSNRWIYIPDATPKLAKVVGLAQTGDTTFTLYLDRGVTGASSSTAYPVKGDLLGYSYSNDGGATGTANGVNVKDGETVSSKQLAPAGSRVTFQDVVLIDATGTDFLIEETK